jgi:hypothetical protein
LDEKVVLLEQKPKEPTKAKYQMLKYRVIEQRLKKKQRIEITEFLQSDGGLIEFISLLIDWFLLN